MKRLFLAVLALLMLALPASAHTPALQALVTFRDNRVSVELRDAYEAPIEGIPLFAATGLMGKTPGARVRLQESRPGVYEGEITPPTDGMFAITLEAEYVNEHFRGALPVTAGEEALLEVGLEEYVPEGYSLTDLALFGSAVLVLVGTGVMVFFRRRGRE